MHFKPLTFSKSNNSSNKNIKTKSIFQQGFTLIEMIVGIVVMSIAFSIFTTLIYPLANQSAEQIHQIRAAELGQSMINEIIGKAFDENSDMSGGLMRCGEAGANACTLSADFGPDGGTPETRNAFNDVDDYHGLNVVETSLGSTDGLADIYVGFSMSVSVINDSNYDGIYISDPANPAFDNNFTAKLITVTVTTPQGFDFVFSTYRVNF